MVRIRTTYVYGFEDVYGIDKHGDLTEVSYSDGTPGATHTYDSRGRRTGSLHDGMTTTRSLNDA